jgi:hypothetical protein
MEDNNTRVLIMYRVVLPLLVLLSANRLDADTIKFSDGTKVNCTVVQESDEKIAFLLHYSLMQIPRTGVQEIIRDSKESTPETPNADGRFPNYVAIVLRAGDCSWAKDVHQIPATVIDTGVMRNVPYKSLNAGRDYEINIYGDPKSPVGFEIGIRGGLLGDERAQANCIEFMCLLLLDKEDVATVHGLKLDKDLVVSKQLTFEVTPPTADDAYGGWWVSVYSEPGLNTVRASDKELQGITVPKSSIAKSGPITTSTDLTRLQDWSPSDLQYARPAKSQSGGGSVYVRGYERKDGTYVQPYTRSMPHSR